MQIQAALGEFLTQLEADGRSEHTRKQYRRHVRKLADWLATGGHSGEITDVTHQDLARFLASTAARTRPDGRAKKATSTNSLRTSVRVLFTYLHESGAIPANPARLIRRAVCSPAPPRALTDDEQRRLLDVLAAADDDAGRRDRALFRTMLGTGIRIGSAVALDVEDVDLEAGEVWLRSMKGGREDRVLLSEEIREHLRDWIGERTTGPLFPGASGARLTTRHANRRLAAWLARAGITRATGTHALRHSFAMRVYEKSGDVLVVKEALRHRSIASTLVYASADERVVREAIG